MNVKRFTSAVLHKKLDLYKEKLYQAQLIENQKINNLGFGYGMRSYHRLKNMSFSQSEKYQNYIEEIEIELKHRAK